MAVETPICRFGWEAPYFRLEGVDGRIWSLDDIAGPRGTLVMFLCNHCPYVRAIIDRLVADVGLLLNEGVGAVAIMSNDTEAYPEDGFEKMMEFAHHHHFPFPYLMDARQAVARDYGAVCTPDFFGFDGDLRLQYRGRLDASRKDPVPGARRELLEAMRRVAKGLGGPAEQIPSMGCSIKWRSHVAA
jgi:peroxiredoxin